MNICKNCGQTISPADKFCVHYGAAISAVEQTSSPAQSVLRSYSGKLSNRYIVKIFLVVFISILLASVAIAVVGGETGVLVVNWLLAIEFFVTIIALPVGFITGLVFLLDHKAGDQSYLEYRKRMGLWFIVGPIIFMLGIVITYTITQVIFRLINS